MTNTVNEIQCSMGEYLFNLYICNEYYGKTYLNSNYHLSLINDCKLSF